MDHNLEDTLNLETAMGSMDFDHSGVVVSQEDLSLETTGHQDDIHMQFENIEEQPMLMDTSNEVIVSDFMGDQFGLQDYSIKNESQNISSTFQTDESDVVITQPETMIDLQFDPSIVTKEVAAQPRYIVTSGAPPRGKKVESTASSTLPRQVAIAPKPPKLAISSFGQASQYSLAPKPISVTANRSLVKKVVPSNVLTQVGKQLVMVQGSGASQKLKLVTSSSGGQSLQNAQIVKNVSGANSKSVLAKVIVQGQGNTEQAGQPAVITKLLPSSGASAQTRYIMQQKTVPLSIGGSKMLFASPTKQGTRFAIKQVVTIKSPNATKLVPVTTPSGATKLVISSNPNQVILKGSAAAKTTQVVKEGNVVVPAQKSQLHQINVPGKGIQYIRLVTNPAKTTAQKIGGNTAIVVPQKNFVFTDAKGKVIQMSGERIGTSQPPPLVFSSGNAKVTAKPQKKLVRIAPLAPKPTPPTTQSQRSQQSLLAPLSPVRENQLDEMSELEHIEQTEEVIIEHDVESKAMLQSLIARAVNNERADMQELKIEYQQAEDSAQSIDEYMNREEDLLSTNYEKHNQVHEDSESRSNDGQNYHDTVNIKVEGMPYMSPKAAASDTERFQEGEGLNRPRKACNCTKSQCLKLYCDCFANGEFCHQCNCNNCHNNLENEELRQKAIRACLDRNPNAFRPKIGKAKTGGQDLIRRHNKGCNCKRSGCLKNYCECYEAKIACTTMCKCVGCRNVEETLERRRARANKQDAMFRPPTLSHLRQPCSFMTSEVIEAVCQCLLAAAVDTDETTELKADADPVTDVIEEFARCLQDIINASHQSSTIPVEGQT